MWCARGAPSPPKFLILTFDVGRGDLLLDLEDGEVVSGNADADEDELGNGVARSLELGLAAPVSDQEHPADRGRRKQLAGEGDGAGEIVGASGLHAKTMDGGEKYVARQVGSPDVAARRQERVAVDRAKAVGDEVEGELARVLEAGSAVGQVARRHARGGVDHDGDFEAGWVGVQRAQKRAGGGKCQRQEGGDAQKQREDLLQRFEALLAVRLREILLPQRQVGHEQAAGARAHEVRHEHRHHEREPPQARRAGEVQVPELSEPVHGASGARESRTRRGCCTGTRA